MIAADEDAVVCDFAETYHVFDYRALPLQTAATLACGLRDGSRIRAKLAGTTAGMDTLMLVQIWDALENIRWMFSEDGKARKNPPVFLAPKLLVGERQPAAKGRFRSASEFEQFRARIMMKPEEE